MKQVVVVPPREGYLPKSLKDFCEIKERLGVYNKTLKELSAKSKGYLEHRKSYKVVLGQIGRGDTDTAQEVFAKYDKNLALAKETDIHIKALKNAIKGWNRVLDEATYLIKLYIKYDEHFTEELAKNMKEAK